MNERQPVILNAEQIEFVRPEPNVIFDYIVGSSPDEKPYQEQLAALFRALKIDTRVEALPIGSRIKITEAAEKGLMRYTVDFVAAPQLMPEGR
jgi:hypothetical protein